MSTSSTKFVFFGPIAKTRWPPQPLIGWDIFDFFSKNQRTEFNETRQEARSHVLYQVCVFRAGQKKTWPPWPLICQTFSTSSLKPLNGIQQNLTGSKISMSSTKSVFFGPVGNSWWPPWLVIGCDIFDFSSEITERNSKKLDRKQDLKVLYQVCVFRADRKNKMAAPASDWLRYFRLLPWNRWTEFDETWQEARSPMSFTKYVFFGPIGKKRWPPWPMIGWDIFDFSSETAEQDSKKFDKKQDLNIFYQVVFFSLMSK